MKKLILIVTLFVGICLFSCGSSPSATKMADELCESMEKFVPQEPMSKYDAASDITEIRKNPEYRDVKETQLKKCMMKKCPDGWKKYLSIKDK